MPPQISDDEGSVGEVASPYAGTGSVGNGTTKPDKDEEEDLKVVSEDEKDDDDDEEQDEDEFVVEAILSHMIDEVTGEIIYEVKWEGYEKEEDKTWEPEVNLATAPDVLESYLAAIGGKQSILDQWAEKREKGGKGKKRGRASTGALETGSKRGRKNGTAASPPAGAKEKEFRPPTGSWEDDVVQIDACEGEDGKVKVYLTWKGGSKTQHPLAQIYKRCPQKMLKFYEQHLVFKKNDEADE